MDKQDHSKIGLNAFIMYYKDGVNNPTKATIDTIPTFNYSKCLQELENMTRALRIGNIANKKTL